MARQSDRLRKGRVSPVPTLSPQVAVQEYAGKQGIANDVYAIGLEVGNAYQKDQMIASNADHRQVITDTLRFAEENPTLDHAQLKQLGLLDRVDTQNLDGSKQENVPRHKWMSLLLEQEAENSRLMYGDRIASPVGRKAWAQTTQENDDAMLRRSLVATASEAFDYQVREMDTRFKTALESGDFDSAGEILNSQTYQDVFRSDPAVLDAMRTELKQTEEIDGFETRMIQGDYEGVMNDVANVERETSLSSDDLRKIYFSADSKQQQVEAENQRMVKAEQDVTYMKTIRGLSTGEIGLADVNANMGAYDRTGYTSAVNFALARQSDASSSTGAIASATENTILMQIKLARAGFYGDEYESLDQFKVAMMMDVSNNMSRFDDVGNVIPGLASTRVNFLMNEIEGLEEVPYASQDYKNLTKQLSLRILRAEEGGFSFLSTEDTAVQMADALDSLHAFMENSETTTPDLTRWRTEQMPRFFNSTGKAAFLNLPPKLKDYAVYSSEGDKFSVDYQATIDAMNEKSARNGQEGRNNATTERNIALFETYWSEHGADVSGANNATTNR